jgi:putative membrane protein
MRKRIAILVGVVALMLAPGIPAQAATPASAQDVAYLRAAHQGNLTEIAAGRIAVRKGTSSEVRGLGARFIRDHRALDLAVVVTATRLRVTLPTSLAPVQRALLRKYRAATSAEFDALFVNTQLPAHRAAMQAGETEIANGSAPAAKRVATKAAPVIAAHHTALRMARGYLS